MNNEGVSGFGVSPAYQLPDSVLEKIEKGMELGDIVDRMTGETKSGHKGGAIDFFSQGKMNRTRMTELCLIMAMVPFLKTK